LFCTQSSDCSELVSELVSSWEDSNTAPNGGDLGFVQQSALDKVQPELRKMVMALQPGQISSVIHTQAGYSILKVFSKEPSGQRELIPD